MATPGLLTWSNNTIFTMVTDPGRQSFSEQIQTHGYDFLDSYFQNIARGPKQTQLIDLVKTPGRNQASPKKKAKTHSKLNKALNFDDIEDKENTSPSRNLETAFLKAKPDCFEPKSAATPLQSRPPPMTLESSPFLVEPSKYVAPTVVVEREASLEEEDCPVEGSVAEAPALSVIPEGDESMDRSIARMSKSIPQRLSARRTSHGGRPESRQSQQAEPALPQEESNPYLAPTTSFPSSATFHTAMTGPSTDTVHTMESFHTVPLDSSPHPDHSSEQVPTRSFEVPEPAVDEPQIEAQPSEEMPVDEEGQAETGLQTYASLEPTSATTTNTNVADAVTEEAASTEAREDTETRIFPTLPDPVPLRKSVHANAFTPAPPPPANMRTSWLRKMREVKALDNTTRKMPIGGDDIVPGVPSGKRKSTDMLAAGDDADEEGEGRMRKVSKNTKDDVAPVKAAQQPTEEKKEAEAPKSATPVEISPAGAQDGMLDRLRKTVEGLGARVGKSMGKSLGGAAAVDSLARARAAAEAKVAERDHGNETSSDAVSPGMLPSVAKLVTPEANAVHHAETPATIINHKELRMSELFMKPKGKGLADESLPKPAAGPKGPIEELRPLINEPVFRPPPVFHPPSPKQIAPSTLPKDRTFSPPSLKSTNVGLQPRIFSPPSGFPRHNNALSAQSTLESMASDNVFHSAESQGDPNWMTSTQETEYSFTAPGKSQPLDDLDADESIVDDPLPEGVRPGTARSCRGRLARNWTSPLARSWINPPARSLISLRTAVMGRRGKRTTFRINHPNLLPRQACYIAVRSQSAISIASTSSSQSQQPRGLFGQASKLVSSVLGSNKKDKQKPEVKSLQLAAAAQKKDQEEKEKAAARKAQMEDRRQQALQRRAEEEKAKALAEEKKMKEEAERRKREREETTEKRLPMMKKKDDEPFKKRKLNTDAAKATTFKPGAVKGNPPVNLPSAASSSKLTKAPSGLPKSASKSKLGPKAHMPSDDDAQPSQMLQSQMAARAQAQLIAAGKAATPPVPSENIELPDIASEYSDSEDEERPKAFVPPEWASADNLRRALEDQSRINPDSVFGAIKPLRMEEIFKETASKSFRMRNRTSSANWSGADRLTAEEEREYAKRMGYVNAHQPQQ